MIWSIVYDKDGARIVAGKRNPQFYSCKRFFADDGYRKFSRLPVDEIVSVDSSLFPCDERTMLDHETAAAQQPRNGSHILRVQHIADDAATFAENIDGFDFCGFDLADDFETSALTNCGGFFDNALTHKDLNALGLIPAFLPARKIQADLKREYPDEEHADCLLFAIWRKV